MNSCASSPKKAEKEIVVLTPETTVISRIYFPAPPSPDGVKITPLDKDKIEVTDPKTPVEYLIIPYSFCKSVLDYIYKTELAVTALHEASHPPDEIKNTK